MTLPVPITSYIVKVASRCNLDCGYCYEYNMGDDSWRRMPRFMEPAVFERLADRIAEHAAVHGIREIYVNLHGGEPLLYGIERTRALLERFTARLEGIRIHWGIQTNGVLLDEAWVELFDAYGFHLGLSIDGPAEVHDRHRVDHRGRGSHTSVMEGVRHLHGTAGRRIFSGCLAVVDPTSDPLGVLHHIMDLGARSIDFLLPHGTWDAPPPGKAPDPMASTPYAEWLIAVFDEWFERHTERVAIRTFEEIVEHLAGGPGRLETIGLQPVSLIVVAVNGDIEGVDTLKSIPGQQVLGLNIARHAFGDVLDHPAYRLRQAGAAALAPECRACPLVTTCGGGYLPHRWSAARGFANPSVYCADLMRLIRHIEGAVRAVVAG